MKTARDFEALMIKVGEMANELDFPPLHPTVTKDDVIDLLNEVYDFFTPNAYVVDGGVISDIEEQLRDAVDVVVKIQDETTEDDIKDYAKDAVARLDFILDPLLEKVGVDC